MEITKLTDFEHSNKVSEISGLLAKYAGYEPDIVEVIRKAALYHDMGKGDIPANILQKPGALTDQEFEVVKTHTKIGCEKIEEVQRILSAASVIAAQHHERLNGKGYMGLAGEEIHPYARIVSVADVFDALISKRVYKEPWPVDAVLLYMKEQSGVHFDPMIVEILLANIHEVLELYEK